MRLLLTASVLCLLVACSSGEDAADGAGAIAAAASADVTARERSLAAQRLERTGNGAADDQGEVRGTAPESSEPGTRAMPEPDPAHLESATPQVTFTTSKGTFVLELDREQAPVTVENFLGYVTDGHYDGLIVHRVIPGFMIQMGGFDPDMNQQPTGAPIRNESGNGLNNERGTVAMARTSDPDSATAQFFVNTVDNPHLDGRGGQPGYAVFGRVIEGMDVVDAIEAVPTGRRGPHGDVPETPVVIESARVTGG